ncbi:MAG: nodulation protein NodH [Paracoccaceae bacterium]
MADRPTWFVVLAGMRTGSNLLEAHLNSAEGLRCHGEAFNPAFVGQPGGRSVLGMTQRARDGDPDTLIDRIVAAPGLNGFRLFPGHSERALERALLDPACAKIVLTRDPPDSFLSLLAARATGQWRISDARDRKTAEFDFDPAEFRTFLDERDRFHRHIARALRTTGQTAFHIGYDDLGDLAIVNGLIAFLGARPIAALAGTVVRQNPGGLVHAVRNRDDMERALRETGQCAAFVPDFAEVRRGPQVPGFVAAKGAPLLYMPVAGVPRDWVLPWLAGIGQGAEAGLTEGFTQSTLRAWMRDRPGHRAFTLVRHPVARAWEAFTAARDTVAPDWQRAEIGRAAGIDLPPEVSGPGASPQAESGALFLAFLKLVRLRLADPALGAVPAAWAGQSAVIAGFSEFRPPDAILRASCLAEGFKTLAGNDGPPGIAAPAPSAALADVFDPSIEAAARAAYARDYINFGFGDWTPGTS